MEFFEGDLQANFGVSERMKYRSEWYLLNDL